MNARNSKYVIQAIIFTYKSCKKNLVFIDVNYFIGITFFFIKTHK